jgi:hypothetical protein
VPLPPRPPLDLATINLSDSDLARSLRRGWEVDRFNELVRRQEELAPAESDELYRYRLRRLALRQRHLERAVAGGTEEELREALDDYRGRLAELRTFEDVRDRGGLPARYETGDVEQRVADRQLQLAELRPRGLLAGGVVRDLGGNETVRLPDVPFAPAGDDAPLYLLVPRSLPSDALARSIGAVAEQGADVHLVHDAGEVPRDRPALVLNWGGTDTPPADLVALNRPEAVRIASDQVESLRALWDLAPQTVRNPQDVQLLGGDRVVAKRRHGTRGSGKRVLSRHGPARERAGFDLYQEFIPNRREFRVSVLSGRVVSAYLKRAPQGTRPDDLSPDWTFERVDRLPRGVAEVARQAASRVGLDYAGVDVVQDLDTDRVLCLEANAAPGMSADTVRGLYATVQELLRGSSG